jgi:hypothetical protein
MHGRIVEQMDELMHWRRLLIVLRLSEMTKGAEESDKGKQQDRHRPPAGPGTP